MPPKLGNDRALRIVAAAREEFARRGFAGARVEQIARRAGVNKQLLFYYYHSKRGLFQAVLTESAGELETALTSLSLTAGGPLERLRLTLQAQFEFLARHPQMVALLGQGSRPGAGGGGGAAFAPAINRLVVLLAEGQGLGQVRDDLDPHLAAAQALILMVGYLSLEAVVAASARPLGADEPALRERWREAAVELVVGGVSAR
ncbi:MAG TPA: TetR/AcrR family transcriptional regulator [Gemmatimonadales bacterium]|nr:TetR/AcrR family transcriptional regulator [Gemmatimonadales bacterium]